MSSKSEYYFADWYRLADSQLTSSVQENRITAIKTLKELDDQNFWLDVVRLYMGVPMKSETNNDVFVSAFKKVDPVFPVSGNAHLLQVLAAILLCFQLEKESDFNMLISLAVLNTNFLKQYNEYTAIPVSDFAKSYLIGKTIEERNVVLEDHIDHVDDLIERIEEETEEETEDETVGFESADHLGNTSAIRAILHSQKVLLEETNILWWLFGAQSVLLGKSFKTIGVPKAIGIIPRELFDLLQFNLGPAKIKSIINKAILDASPSKTQKSITTLELIDKLTSDELKMLLNDAQPSLEFTPVLSGAYKAIQFESLDWSAMYKKDFQEGDLKKGFLPTELALQIFNELLFINCQE